MTKLEKMAHKLNEDFRDKLVDAVKSKFDFEIKNEFDIFSMKLIIFRKDGLELTKDQHDFIEAYSNGFIDALNIVRDCM